MTLRVRPEDCRTLFVFTTSLLADGTAQALDELMLKQIEEQLAILRQEIDFLALKLHAQANDIENLARAFEQPAERARYTARVFPPDVPEGRIMTTGGVTPP